ncbi:uncharacterized protein LOC125040147 isoform X2 [Penaeus chinensis]|uniref:uncharacterized protein LOC125040147 isoform X2 n=1 Tax=Penaeus chinensis TaxID=139456 RepID=UPI001FB7F8BA|nr:uncharacterized protein LOC125040147 isoform X2 [Penaeus chinensis]
MKISMVVCLYLVSAGIKTSASQACTNVTVAVNESSPLYPVADDELTEVLIYMPTKDFGSAAVFLGSDCIVQLLQLGSKSARSCLFVHSINRKIALVFERNTSALSVFKRKNCSLILMGEAPLPPPGSALRVVPGGQTVVTSYNCFLDEFTRSPVSCPSLKPWVLTCSALIFALLAVLVACPLRGRLQALHERRDPNSAPAAHSLTGLLELWRGSCNCGDGITTGHHNCE